MTTRVRTEAARELMARIVRGEKIEIPEHISRKWDAVIEPLIREARENGRITEEDLCLVMTC